MSSQASVIPAGHGRALGYLHGALLALLLFAGYWAPTRYAPQLDDDRLYLYATSLALADDARYQAFHQPIQAALADAGYPEYGQQRLAFRNDHRHNYLLHTLTTLTMRNLSSSLWPGLDWELQVPASITAGLLAGHLLLAALLLLVVWLCRVQVPVAVSSLLLAIFGLGTAAWLLLSGLRPLVEQLLAGGHPSLAFGLRALQKLTVYFLAGGHFGFSPRNSFCLLLVAAYLLRRAGRPRLAYALLPLAVLVHGSNGMLLLLALVGIDFLRAPERLRDAVVIAMIALASALSLVLDAAWSYLSTEAQSPALWLIPLLPLLAVAAAHSSAANWLRQLAVLRWFQSGLESRDSLRICTATLALAAAIGISLLLRQQDPWGHLITLLSLVHAAAIVMHLLYVAWMDWWVCERLLPGIGAARSQQLSLAALVLASGALIAASLSRPPYPPPRVMQPATVSDTELRQAVLSGNIDGTDRILFSAIVRDFDRADGSVQHLVQRLRQIAEPPP